MFRAVALPSPATWGVNSDPWIPPGTLQELKSALSLALAVISPCPRGCAMLWAEIRTCLVPGSSQDPTQARGVQDSFRQWFSVKRNSSEKVALPLWLSNAILRESPLTPGGARHWQTRISEIPVLLSTGGWIQRWENQLFLSAPSWEGEMLCLGRVQMSWTQSPSSGTELFQGYSQLQPHFPSGSMLQGAGKWSIPRYDQLVKSLSVFFTNTKSLGRLSQNHGITEAGKALPDLESDCSPSTAKPRTNPCSQAKAKLKGLFHTWNKTLQLD